MLVYIVTTADVESGEGARGEQEAGSESAIPESQFPSTQDLFGASSSSSEYETTTILVSFFNSLSHTVLPAVLIERMITQLRPLHPKVRLNKWEKLQKLRKAFKDCLAM